MNKKKIVFLTGTRADFGKIKPIIQGLKKSPVFEAYIFATGMHMLPKYGVTAHEILKEGFENIYFYNNQALKNSMDISLANTIYGFSCYIEDVKPDMIVVHGDRAEALAGAIVGSFNNIRVAHIEGGEVSGTIDGLIRHSVTKLSHIHFVTNDKAKRRVMQLGETEDSIFVIGSPEIDIMLSDNLPDISKVKEHYDIPFNEYSVLVYHPVTTENGRLGENIKTVVDSVIESGLNYIVIHPNNDTGSDIILDEYKRFEGLDRIRAFPSIRFEYFLTLFKNCKFIIGNSSAGICEAPMYGVPTVNIGTRQFGRGRDDSIFDISENKEEILDLIMYIDEEGLRFEPSSKFGDGQSIARFIDHLDSDAIWSLPLQKEFEDYRNRRSRKARSWRRTIGELASITQI